MRRLLSGSLLALLMLALPATTAFAQVTRYVRYSHQNRVAYGILDGDTVRELSGSPLTSPKPTGRTVKLAEVKLLAPIDPGKVIAVGLNYQSHIGQQKPAKYPGLFAKYPSSIIGPEATIPYPADATDLHFEGELVLVIGKKAVRVSKADALSYVFGVTVGNDVSERQWQRDDLQWFRAKASDGFGPLGPAIVTGVKYDDVLLTTRLNGEVVQNQRTKDLIFNCADIVSYVSQYVTLERGDIIYTGTPQNTKAMKPGDTIEVEIENVGLLRNKIGPKGGTN